MRKILLLILLCPPLFLQADRPLGLTSLTSEIPNTRLMNSGDVPIWLDGTLVRNGPALFNIGDTYVPHWFDGLAMLHAFRFLKGEVYYQNKFLRTSAYEQVFVNKSLDFPGFGQAGAKNESVFLPNANVNVARFANNYVALTETPLPVVFDLTTLNTVGHFPYDDSLPKSRIWECAHPQHDAETGEVLNYQVQFFPEAKYVIYRMKKGSKTREVIAQIPVAEPAYMHSFAITPNYVILVEFPLFINPQDILKGGSFSSHYKWKETKKMRILTVSRKTGEMAGEYFAEPIFAWHHINSFEDAGTLVIDLAGYQDATTFLQQDDGADPEQKRVARFVRYKIDLASKKVIKEQVGPSLEMPRINYDTFNGKPYNFVYGYDDSRPQDTLKKRGLLKVDAKTKHAIVWQEDGCIADEPLFVQRPGATAEDDGVVLAVVLDTKKRHSFLLILDARKFKEVGRLEVPHHIPYGLHGEYFMKK